MPKQASHDQYNQSYGSEVIEEQTSMKAALHKKTIYQKHDHYNQSEESESF